MQHSRDVPFRLLTSGHNQEMMPSSAAAVEFAGPRQVRVAAVALPEPGPDEVVVTTHFSGISGGTGHGIDLASDLVVPAPDLLGLLVCHVRSAPEELGEYRAAVAMLTTIVRCGNGASRQRRALRIRNHVSDVTAMAAQSTLQVGGAAPSSGADVLSLPIPRNSPRVAVKNGLP
jgi:hypothetical protein